MAKPGGSLSVKELLLLLQKQTALADSFRVANLELRQALGNQKAIVAAQNETIARLEETIRERQRQLGRNSRNSPHRKKRSLSGDHAPSHHGQKGLSHRVQGLGPGAPEISPIAGESLRGARTSGESPGMDGLLPAAGCQDPQPHLQRGGHLSGDQPDRRLGTHRGGSHDLRTGRGLHRQSRILGNGPRRNQCPCGSCGER